MTKQVKKRTVHQASKKQPSSSKALESTLKAEKKIFKMESEMGNTVARASHDMGHMAKECETMCNKSLKAFAESGNAAVQAFQNISKEISEGSSQMFSECAELSQEAFTCKTISDIMEFQNKAIQQMTNSFSEMTSKMFKIMLDSSTKTLAANPLPIKPQPYWPREKASA